MASLLCEMTRLTSESDADVDSDLTHQLCHTMLKQGKSRTVVLDTHKLSVSYSGKALGGSKEVLKGVIDLQDVQLVHFDMDDREDDKSPHKKFQMVFDVGSREYRFSPLCDMDFQCWLKEIIQLPILSDKVFRRLTNVRGTLQVASGKNLEQLLSVHEKKYERFYMAKEIHARHHNPLLASEGGKKIVQSVRFRCHVHGITADSCPVLCNVSPQASITMLMKTVLEAARATASEEADEAENKKKLAESTSDVLSDFMIRVLVTGKRFSQDKDCAWYRRGWYDTSANRKAKAREIECFFFQKCTPLVSLLLRERFNSDDVLPFIELVPSHLVPQLQIHVNILRVQRNKEQVSGKMYSTYMINVENGSLKWILSRRYKEFSEFQKKLLGAYSEDKTVSLGRPLPRLPSKTIQKSFGLNFVDRRRRLLIDYLNKLLSHPWASSRPEVLAFLGFMSEHAAQSSAVNNKVIHISKVRDFVQTGDVILFQSRNSLSGFQRAITFSDWDHAAVVIRRNETVIDILEATGDGVQIYPLVNRLLVYSEHITSKIVIRSLTGSFPLPREDISSIFVKFIKKVEGKPYSLSPKKLLLKDGLGDSSSKSSYFCSELVAAAYQEAGLLADAESSTNMFWPSSFMPGGLFERCLIKGIKLGEPIELNCREVEVGYARKLVRNKSSRGAVLFKPSSEKEKPAGAEDMNDLSF
jgi:hypothetical protein